MFLSDRIKLRAVDISEYLKYVSVCYVAVLVNVSSYFVERIELSIINISVNNENVSICYITVSVYVSENVINNLYSSGDRCKVIMP